MAVRVLVAEDNDEYRTVLRMLFSTVGCTVVEARNGLEAIEKTESTHPDLIIMDWIMPHLGGLEATKQLKENPKTRDIPIVICTALSIEALGHTKLLDCAQEIIQKPIRLEKIREIVRKYAPQKNQQRTLSPVKHEQHGANVLEAWRVLRKVQQKINEESLNGRMLQAHNFDRREEDAAPSLLSATQGRKLFAGLVHLLHGGIGCLELLSIG